MKANWAVEETPDNKVVGINQIDSRFRICIPNKIIKLLGLQIGENLAFIAKKDKLMIKVMRVNIQLSEIPIPIKEQKQNE